MSDDKPQLLADACDQLDAMWRVGARLQQRVMDLEGALLLLRGRLLAENPRADTREADELLATPMG